MITKKRALGITRQLFIWLAEHPDKEKIDWTGWEKYGYMSSLCACCQYINDHDLTCEGCPIDWASKGGSRKVMPCLLNNNSPYGKYRYADTTEDRSKYALEVVALAVAAEKEEEE